MQFCSIFIMSTISGPVMGAGAVGMSGMSALGVGELPSATGLLASMAIMASCMRVEGIL